MGLPFEIAKGILVPFYPLYLNVKRAKRDLHSFDSTSFTKIEKFLKYFSNHR